MNVMIKKLLQGQAVQWKTVDEIFDIRNGYTPSKRNKEYWENGTVPWFRMEDIRENGRILNSAIQYVNKSGVKGRLFSANSIMLSTTATIGEHALITVDYLSNQQISNFSLKKEYTELLNIKFVFYYFFIISKKAKKSINNSSMPSVQMNKLKKIQIPIPPLSVQSHIVQILDTFTELTDQLRNELTAELSMRQKQYQYYRDLLLSEHELAKVGFEWKTLGEVVLPTNNIKWDESDLSYRYIDLSSVDKDNNNIGETLEITSKNAPSRAQKIVKKDDVIFATTRPTQMRSALIPPNLDGQIASTGYCILRANQNEVLPKWIYYNLQIDEFKIYLQGKQSGTAYPAISDGLIKQFQIPIPPLSAQSQIVAILDTFDTLTQSISEGLPKEIQLRQKQYEYYRELLLGFGM